MLLFHKRTGTNWELCFPTSKLNVHVIQNRCQTPGCTQLNATYQTAGGIQCLIEQFIPIFEMTIQMLEMPC